jgi:hypothetical protein
MLKGQFGLLCSIDPLFTVAYFSGVGLQIIPPPALYNSLKGDGGHDVIKYVAFFFSLGVFSSGSYCWFFCSPYNIRIPSMKPALELSHNKITAIEGFWELT